MDNDGLSWIIMDDGICCLDVAGTYVLSHAE